MNLAEEKKKRRRAKRKYPPKMFGSKVCLGCEEEKSYIDFPADRERKDGRHSRCKVCRRQADRESSGPVQADAHPSVKLFLQRRAA